MPGDPPEDEPADPVGRGDRDQPEHRLDEDQPPQVLAEAGDDGGRQQQRIPERSLQDRVEAEAARQIVRGGQEALAVARHEERRHAVEERETQEQADREDQGQRREIGMAAPPGQDAIRCRQPGRRPSVRRPLRLSGSILGWGDLDGALGDLAHGSGL